MGRFSKLNWVLFCGLVFIVSRAIMLYQFSLANDIFVHHYASFFDSMCKWDCQWYLTIIHQGYDVVPRTAPKVWRGHANWAFFPLYPYVVRYLALITKVSPITIGVILNQLSILVAMLIFYRYLKLFFDELNSRFGVILLAFSPFSIYFASVYTEAFFLLFSLSGFYLMRINRPYLSAICGGLLSATRPTGVMFSLAYFYHGISKRGFRLSVFLGSLIAVSGLLLYMLYLHFHTGDFLAFQHIQVKWGRTGLHFHTLGRQLMDMVRDYHNSTMFILSCIISIYLFFNKYVEEALFNLCCILPGVLSGAMLSEARFSGTLFTFYFGFVVLSRKSNSLKITCALLFFLFYFSYFLYWMAHAKFLI